MKVPVLDHGYVKFVEAWGTGDAGRERDDVSDFEVGIIEAARQSTQGSFRGWEQDARLLTYLYENNHDTPFEFAGLVIEVQAPIFVFREWHRHRTQSYNEMSARYTPLPDLYYVPDLANVLDRAQRAKSPTTKQMKALEGTDALTEESLVLWHADIEEFYLHAEQLYQGGLKAGIPKEIARIVMPVGHYTRMRASANLRNWLSFLTLRMDPAAQWEIRQYALAVSSIIQEKFPQTHNLFIDGR